MEKIVTHNCTRCKHSANWHSLSEPNVSPVDPNAEFSCNGPQFAGCAVVCPDFQGEAITIAED